MELFNIITVGFLFKLVLQKSIEDITNFVKAISLQHCEKIILYLTLVFFYIELNLEIRIIY